jgi:putative PEP-CTERM system histidine kinase
LPGSWLLFNLSFPKRDNKPTLGKWKWIVPGIFLAHLILVTIFVSDFFCGTPVFDPFHGWMISLGWSGYLFHICFLVSSVLIIMFLEKTLRASSGRQRWQVKFIAIGIGAIFAARLYTGSQALLLHNLHLELEVVNGSALFVAGFLIFVSIFRGHFLHTNIYLSETMLYRSFTLLIVGIYLLAISALALATGSVQDNLVLALRAFFIFLAIVGLTIALLSDRLRLKMKQLISRHFKRSEYDYRNAWIAFTERTASMVQGKAFCNAIVKMISEMFDVLSVSLWLLNEPQKNLKLGGSTVFSEAQVRELPGFQDGAAAIIQFMRNRQIIVDLEAAEAEILKRSHVAFFQDARIRYCIPLMSSGNLLGIITLGDRVKETPFSFEALDMLKTIADQVAAGLLNLRLSEQLQQAREMEAFQTISALFTHDLKNLASKLSLLLQNLPVHFDNPDFRKDALRSMSESVKKIDGMCGRLSIVRERLELHPVKADLNEVFRTTLAGIKAILKAGLVEDLHPMPMIFLDPEQIRKVIRNLVLNADQAAGKGGEIRVTTGTQNGWAALMVSDNGCGISKEFMDQYLFRPFSTTKKQGTGIGLFHSKMIVDAHNGRIEVESEEGKGSTFRVLLPISGGQGSGFRVR